MTRIGEYRHVVQFFREVDLPDGEDGLSPSEVPVCEARVALQPLEGREFERARQRDARATHLVRMRYRPGIDARLRFRCAGRVFEVTSAPLNIDERNRELHLFATERV